jgi:hypothetical protein
MIRKLIGAVSAFALLSATPVLAGSKDYAMKGYAMPADKPVTVLLMRPDVQVSELAAGGLPTPNADWTNAARDNLAKALEANQKAKGVDFKIVSPSTPEGEQLVADYEKLHRAVADSIVEFAYGAKLPTKKGKGKDYVFDWTLGPGTQQLGKLEGGNYALFFFSLDAFSSASRKAMQAAGMLGCLVGFCVIVRGGVHISYASLVEVETGNIVWFNIQRGSKGDIRESDGAVSMVNAVLDSMPTKGGVETATASKKRK